MKKRILSASAVVVVAVAVAAFAAMHMMAPPDDLDLSRSRTSEKGLYQVAIAPDAEPVEQAKLHAWTVTVKRQDGSPVEDAAIAVDGGMPSHGHGLPTAPQAGGHLGEGRYRIEGVRFNMTGWWELKLTIDSAAGKDSAVFNLLL